METVETLQAGGAGEREQRVVSLTAQLLAARSKEALQERRAEDLLVRGLQGPWMCCDCMPGTASGGSGTCL
jgi:hypothetical protein